MKDPVWLALGTQYVGQKEVPGKGSNPWITSLWASLGGAWVYATGSNDDSAVPWCGAFIGWCMKESNITLPKNWFRAKSWLDWGLPIYAPMRGCVVVFERVGGGHVGLVAGRAQDGRLMVLGGNQHDSVSIAPFEASRIAGFRWPMEFMSDADKFSVTGLPILAANGQPTSYNEA